MARPKSVRAHEDVLDAALALFAERGIDATSMDAIAEAAGVSKATIYKHWADKDALCLEVMARAHGRDETPDIDTGDLREDLLAILGHTPPSRYAALRPRLMPHLIAYAARHPAFGQAWRTRVLEPPRTQLAHALGRAIMRGELPETLNVDLSIAMLLGPMLYRHVLRLATPEVVDNQREAIVDAFLRAHAVTTASRRRGSRARTGAGRAPASAHQSL